MKKRVFLFLFLSTLLFGKNNKSDIWNSPETKTIIEKEIVQENYGLEKRLNLLKEHEKNILEIEKTSGIDRTKELETLDKKYDEILKKFTSSNFKSLKKNEQEEKLLRFEEKNYRDFYNRITEIERNYSK